MVVEVKLFATFREGRFNERELELPEASSLSDLLKYLTIPEKDATFHLANFIFSIHSVDKRRIKKIKVRIKSGNKDSE